MKEVKPKQRGLFLGIFLIAIAVALLVAAEYCGLRIGPFRKGAGTILLGVYFQYLGTLFLMSYYFRDRSFLFRALMWVCEHFSRPVGHPKMAFFYFALGFGLGTLAVLYGLGVFTR